MSRVTFLVAFKYDGPVSKGVMLLMGAISAIVGALYLVDRLLLP